MDDGVKEVRLNVGTSCLYMVSYADRVKYWLSVGAQPSDTVALLLGRVYCKQFVSCYRLEFSLFLPSHPIQRVHYLRRRLKKVKKLPHLSSFYLSTVFYSIRVFSFILINMDLFYEIPGQSTTIYILKYTSNVLVIKSGHFHMLRTKIQYICFFKI